MYLEAVELMEDDSKEGMALDIFRQAIGVFVHCRSTMLQWRCCLHVPTPIMLPSRAGHVNMPVHYHLSSLLIQDPMLALNRQD